MQFLTEIVLCQAFIFENVPDQRLKIEGKQKMVSSIMAKHEMAKYDICKCEILLPSQIG